MNKYKRTVWAWLILPCIGLLWNTLAVAQEGSISEYFGATLDEETKASLQERITAMSADKDKHAEYTEAMRHRTVLCKACHGEDGKAVKPLTPNLAGQNIDYLIDQMKRYQSGDRFDYWMGSLSKGFSDEDIIKIAIKYSGMPGVVSADGDPKIVAKGKEIFKATCTECHGDDGKGNKGYARLAGQRADYVVKILKEFRDRTGRRSNPWMTAVSLRLSDADMEAVGSYISHMP